MDKAKAAISSFTSKAGHHDTTVHKTVAPHVQHETVNTHQTEERTLVHDREVHQDHYHTTVQPIQDREVLPEQHHHNVKTVEHRQHDHRNHDETQHRIQQEAAKYTHQTKQGATHHTTTEAPAVGGEHIHHHIHETVQPIIQKETIQPHVVHTVIPIHEVHHNEAQHHSACSLPAVSLADFKKSGGTLDGNTTTTSHHEGIPKSIESLLGHERDGKGTRGVGSGIGGHNTTGTGVTGSGIGHKEHGLGHNTHNTTGTGVTGHRRSSSSSRSSSDLDRAGTTSSKTKPSLLNRLNPLKDTDGDGKKGIMD